VYLRDLIMTIMSARVGCNVGSLLTALTHSESPIPCSNASDERWRHSPTARSV